MWRWQPDATEAVRLGGSNSSGSYYRLASDRDPESLALDYGLFTDGPAEIIPFRRADVVGIIVYVLLLLLYAAAVMALPWISAFHQYVEAVVAGNGAVLVMSGVVERQVREGIQALHRQGFLRLSKELEVMAGAPFAVVAYGTAGALLLVQWQEEVEEVVKVPALLLLQAWLVVEVVLAGGLAAWHLCKMWRHNCMQGEPDAVRLLASLMRPQEVRSVKQTEGRLVEEQATVLLYQQQNLLFFGREIVRLRESLSKYQEQAEGGIRPDVDAVLLLGVREQELRAVTAERDQLQGEVRLSRRDISERDAGLVKSRANIENLMEENARLRAMLDEWSSHAAKVELALEAERVANADFRKAHTSAHSS